MQTSNLKYCQNVQVKNQQTLIHSKYFMCMCVSVAGESVMSETKSD